MVRIVLSTQLLVISSIMTLLPTGSGLPTPEQEPAKGHRQAPVQLCDIGFTACYVGKFPSPWKRSTSTSWECVDVHNNIETCGGCEYPVDGASSGKDCTDMEGIDEVTCNRGHCEATSCMRGFLLKGTECKRNPSYKPFWEKQLE